MTINVAIFIIESLNSVHSDTPSWQESGVLINQIVDYWNNEDYIHFNADS